jgi:hypothetical protein
MNQTTAPRSHPSLPLKGGGNRHGRAKQQNSNAIVLGSRGVAIMGKLQGKVAVTGIELFVDGGTAQI